MSTEGNNGEKGQNARDDSASAKNTARSGKKMKVTTPFDRIIIFGSVVATILPIWIALWYMGGYRIVSPWVSGKEKVHVEAFLKEKYGKEFVAVKCEKQLVRLFFGCSLITEVYLAEDPDISFSVWRGADIDMKSEEAKELYRVGELYYDDYLTLYWSKEINREIEGEVIKNFGLQQIFNAKVQIINRDVTKQMYGYTPSYQEFSTDIDSSFYMSVFDEEPNEIMSDKQLDSVWNIVESLRCVALPIKRVEITFYSMEHKIDVLNDIPYDGSDGAYENLQLEKNKDYNPMLKPRSNYYKYDIVLSEEVLQAILTPEDLKEYVGYNGNNEEEGK